MLAVDYEAVEYCSFTGHTKDFNTEQYLSNNDKC